MKFNKGFSMVGLMAVVAIVAIIAVVSLPVYNQYIERTKVSKEIPVIGTYKHDIASCFMKNDSLEDCNDGESGIHPGLDNNGKILSLDIFKGNIVMIIDAQNHVENVEPVELMYVINPNVDPTYPTLDWTLYCNDYSSNNNALVKECKGLITDKDGDGYDDSVEEEWGSDPLDPDSVPVNWEPIASTYTNWTNAGGRVYTSGWMPAVSSQTSDFTQTRSYTQDQTRERTDREQDSFSGNIRVVDVVTEEQTIGGNESRNVLVSSGSWVNTGGNYSCGSWTPNASNQTSDFTQERSCSQDQEKQYNYSVGGFFTDERTITETQSRNVSVSSGNWVNSGSPYNCGAWSPSLSGQTSDFTQTRSCSIEQEKEYNYSIGGGFTDTRVSSTTQSRTVDVSGNLSGGNDGWSSWSTYNTSCGNWGPSTSTVNSGQSFTQTRSCTDYQERFKYYLIDGQVVNSDRDTRTTTRTESRSATGTKPVKECRTAVNGGDGSRIQITTRSSKNNDFWGRAVSFVWNGSNVYNAGGSTSNFGSPNLSPISMGPIAIGGYNYTVLPQKDYTDGAYRWGQTLCREPR